MSKKFAVDVMQDKLATMELRERQLQIEQAEWEHDAFLAERAGNFYLFGEIDPENSFKLIQDMEKWWVAYGDKYDTISLTLNSEGGELASGLAIHDTLRAFSTLGAHVNVGVRGEACSMAAVVLQAGDTRLMGAASRLMLHQVSSGGTGTTAEIRRQSEHLEATDKAIAELFAKRSGVFTVEWLEKEILDQDRWFGPAEALEVGLIDYIG